MMTPTAAPSEELVTVTTNLLFASVCSAYIIKQGGDYSIIISLGIDDLVNVLLIKTQLLHDVIVKCVLPAYPPV
jgi:hypothetical protein